VHDHSHAHVSAGADRRRLAFALGLILSFMVAEVTAGILAHSLALLSDAAHMLTDAGAIGLSLLALWLAARPPSGSMTYGLRRAEILSAQANGAILLVLAGLIVYEAIRRLVSPPDVQGWTVVVVAIVGIVVNLVATWQLSKANRANMAVEGSFQHILTDLYAFVGTAIAGAIIVTTGYSRADPIASLFVAALMLRASYALLKESGRVLLEMAPARMDMQEIGEALVAHPQVTEVHDLHVWEIGTDLPALSAHVLVRRGVDCHAVRLELERLLHDRFDLEHTTLQVEHTRQSPLVELQRLSDSGR
jgi:cobalt-zinc-cadmium efflux system protein